jgi:hypothetical protein
MYLGFLLVTRFHQFNSHPLLYIKLLVAAFSLYSYPIIHAKQVKEIRREAGELVFRYQGRPPLMPFGPRPVEGRVPVGSGFSWKWSRLLVSVPGGAEYEISFPRPVRKKTVAAWFEQVGLGQPFSA